MTTKKSTIEDALKKYQVIARTKVEGIHRWKKCPLDEVSYLREYHRHVFHIEATLDVNHTNRDVEFIQLTHTIIKVLHAKYYSVEHQCCFFDDMSCEMIADELVDAFNLTSCEVNEDGEGGAIITRDILK